MLQHGFGDDWGEYFAGETCGMESGRNDAENFTRHTRSYHETRVLDSKEKGKPPMMLPSCRKFLLCSALIASFTAWGQPNLDIRPKPGEKAEVRPQAILRIDSNLVLIPVTVTDPMNRFVTGLEKDSFK